jgi:hypothetical protein
MALCRLRIAVRAIARPVWRRFASDIVADDAAENFAAGEIKNTLSPQEMEALRERLSQTGRLSMAGIKVCELEHFIASLYKSMICDSNNL